MRSLISRLATVALTALLMVVVVAPTEASTIRSGYHDTLLARHTNSNLYAYGGGASYLSPGMLVGHGWGGFDYGIQIASLNGADYGDVIVRSPDGLLRIYHSDGTSLSGGYQIGNGWAVMADIVPADDWDGDGRPDLLARHKDGRLLLYPTEGAGDWGRVRQIGQGWSQIDMMAVPGDLTGDGVPDLIGRHVPTGRLLLYPGDGEGGFDAMRVIGHGWENFKNITSIGDFNRDGRPDIIAQRADGRLFRYSSLGGGWWSKAVQIGHGWQNMTLPGRWKTTTVAGPPAPRPSMLRQPFVYGTLRTGDRGYHMVRGRVLSERRATVAHYALWVTHNGTWPWAIPSPTSRPIVGQIMEFPASTLSANLTRLDIYEGYYPGRDINTMRYFRNAATTTDGEPVWIYETSPRQAQWVVRNGYRVTNGDWFNQVRAYAARSAMGGGGMWDSPGAESNVLVNAATELTTCHSELGSLEGQFLHLDLSATAPESTEQGYISVPAESFMAVDSQGNWFAPFDESAQFCSATNDQLIAFVDDGVSATGTLTLSGDIAELYWVNDDGDPILIWSKNPVASSQTSETTPAEESTVEGEPTLGAPTSEGEEQGRAGSSGAETSAPADDADLGAEQTATSATD